jgi:rhamnogalacturonyl hydrolase YesR
MVIREFLYKTYCLVHRLVKVIIQGDGSQRSWRMVDINSDFFSKQNHINVDGSFINEMEIQGDVILLNTHVFPIENLVEIGSNYHLKDSYQRKGQHCFTRGVTNEDSLNYWKNFINNSVIPDGFRYSGLHFTGYISDNIYEWCLPSWIWTNAALVRLYCSTGDLDNATRLGDLLIELQQDCGGWLVRFDYSADGAIPTLAPNDSAYIANNAFLELFKVTHNISYLKVAMKCADWIIQTARPDGIVFSGFDMKKNVWIKTHNIVDIGFTAALFANLYEITNDSKYKIFLNRFVTKFINLFYIPESRGFTTSLNEFDEQVGGMFGRGQAWALEGLIPAFRVLNTKEINDVIEETIKNLLSKQLQNGGWAYNFKKPFLGEDCKAVSVIAKNLLEWNQIKPNPVIISSALKALIWCQKHTSNSGEHKGGIFSFNMEGAINHHLYTRTAFVYSSSYAIELYIKLRNHGNNNTDQRHN